MLRVGLTGGIACGKTAVAEMMRELGCHIIESDEVARRLVDPGEPAYDEIIRLFGRQVLLPDGNIDRAKLADVVFANPPSLQSLNRILHPRVIAAIRAQLIELNHAGAVEIAVVVAALHIEAGFTEFDRMVVVFCSPEQQLERLRQRGLSAEDALARITQQMPIGEKRRIADERGYDLINATGSLAETRRQVVDLVARLKQLAEV